MPAIPSVNDWVVEFCADLVDLLPCLNFRDALDRAQFAYARASDLDPSEAAQLFATAHAIADAMGPPQ